MATITTRSGKGSALTHTELDNNFTNLNTDKVEASGDTITGNLDFNDNVKARFGAGQDLEIYHDGTNSYIDDDGVGSLFLRADNQLVLKSKIQNANFVQAIAGGEVRLFHDGSQKLRTEATGIDVNGTVTADNANVSFKVEIGGTTPRIELFESDTTDLNTRIRNTVGTLQIQSTDDAGTTSKTRIAIDHATGDISFREDTGTDEKFYWDASAESLGIGTSSPSKQLTVSAFTDTTLRLESTKLGTSAGDVMGALEYYGSDTSTGSAGVAGKIDVITENNLPDYSMRFFTRDQASGGSLNEAMRINSNGNVLFGKTSTGTTNIGTQITGDGFTSIVNTNNNILLYLQNKATNGNCRISFANDSHGGASLGLNNNGDFTLFDTTAATTRFNVTSDRFLTASGGLAGIALGGTAAANILDDYEEGTFTPELADANTGGNTGTAATIEGAYTKVGRMITVTFRAVDIDTTGMTGSAGLRIRALPFISGSGIKGISEGSVRLDNFDLSDSAVSLSLQILSGTTYLLVRQTRDNDTDSNVTVAMATSGSADIFGSITYFE